MGEGDKFNNKGLNQSKNNASFKNEMVVKNNAVAENSHSISYNNSCLLCTRHYAKQITYSSSINSHTYSVGQIL